MTPPETLALGRAGGRPDTPGWTVRVVPNKFPAIPGQEVVVHGPRHVRSIVDVEPEVMALAVGVWRLREQAHLAAGAAWVLACVNEGAGAGASLDHSHSQIVPFPTVPPTIQLDMAATGSGDCRLCTALAGERPRLLREADGLATFCPAWSRMPYETWIAPVAHRPRWADPAALATALVDAVARLRSVTGGEPAWNAVVHEGPAGADFHWHVELMPRLTVPASVELGTGVWVNVVDPDAAASELRGP